MEKSAGHFETEKLELALNRGLSPDEVQEVEQYERGRFLRMVVESPGWDVVKELLESYLREAVDDLTSVSPESRDKVVALHSTAYASVRFYKRLMEDIQQAVNAPVPGVLKELARTRTPAPPQAMF